MKSTHPDLAALFRASLRADRVINLVSGADNTRTLDFAELGRLAGAAAGAMAAKGVRPGHELVIYTRSNRTFLIGFWGAVLAGAVPVPIAVGKTEEQRQKLTRILTQLRHPALLEDSDAATVAGIATDRRFSVDEFDRSSASRPDLEPREAADLAFIQYSSGSTGDPKGVCISHGNITAHCDAILATMSWTDQHRGLSWMPLTHDMGLIVMHLSQFAAGMSHTIIDTDVFIRRPQLWLERATADQAHVLCSPNFGYRHFLKFYDRRPSQGISLENVTTIFNGAEPISRAICDEFLTKMAPLGLRSTAMLPVYGLAEGTVGVTVMPLDEPLASVFVDRHRLRIGEPVAHLAASHDDALEFVKVGAPLRYVELRIVGDDDVELPHEHVGHIQIRGASVTAGYYGLSAETRDAKTVDGWYRTGDCGFIDGGQLVVSGRMKDIVIISGQNYYAHDLERFAFDIGSLELGKVAVAAARRQQDADEQTVVFALFRGSADDFRPLAERIAESIAGATGVTVDYVVPVPRIPKTTSGKVQRSVLAQNFAMGEYDGNAVSFDADGSAPTPPADDVGTLDNVLAICAQHAAPIQIGPDDDLFDVGISSLTLTEISLGIDERFPGVVSIDDLFDCPTPRQIAQRIDAAA
ncbi:MAG: non-ribosomal peptide synthetase [Pseudomonadota bacterium]